MAVNNRELLKVIKFYTATVARACALEQHVKGEGYRKSMHAHMWTDTHSKVHTVKTSFFAQKRTSVTDSEKATYLFTVVRCAQIHLHSFFA